MGARIDDDVLHACAVVAEPADVAAEIRRRFGGLIDRVSFYCPYETRTQTLGRGGRRHLRTVRCHPVARRVPTVLSLNHCLAGQLTCALSASALISAAMAG